MLLARRLIEAGTRLACISWAPDANATWDTHGNNFNTLKKTLLPQLDAARSRVARGPDLAEECSSGRWSWSWASSAAARRSTPARAATTGTTATASSSPAAGIKAGHVHGASDKIGAIPQTDPVTPAEIVATIYRCLGIPADLELHDQFQRPLTVVPQPGLPINELLS